MWKLIEARLAQPPPERRHVLLAVELVRPVRSHRGARAHDLRDVGPVLAVVGVLPHGPELERRELAHPQPEACLAEEDGSLGRAVHPPGNEGEQWREQHQCDGRADDVDGALQV